MLTTQFQFKVLKQIQITIEGILKTYQSLKI
jgi:hypothetical protein